MVRRPQAHQKPSSPIFRAARPCSCPWGFASPLFRFSYGVPLSRPHVTDWLRSILAAAGVQDNYSSHSFRIGAATSASAAGIPDSLIRTLRGRWCSDAYLVYIRTAQETLRSAASRLASVTRPALNTLKVLFFARYTVAVPLSPCSWVAEESDRPHLRLGGWRRLSCQLPGIITPKLI